MSFNHLQPSDSLPSNTKYCTSQWEAQLLRCHLGIRSYTNFSRDQGNLTVWFVCLAFSADLDLLIFNVILLRNTFNVFDNSFLTTNITYQYQHVGNPNIIKITTTLSRKEYSKEKLHSEQRHKVLRFQMHTLVFQRHMLYPV